MGIIANCAFFYEFAYAEKEGDCGKTIICTRNAVTSSQKHTPDKDLQPNQNQNAAAQYL